MACLCTLHALFSTFAFTEVVKIIGLNWKFVLKIKDWNCILNKNKSPNCVWALCSCPWLSTLQKCFLFLNRFHSTWQIAPHVDLEPRSSFGDPVRLPSWLGHVFPVQMDRQCSEGRFQPPGVPENRLLLSQPAHFPQCHGLIHLKVGLSLHD